MAGGVAGVPVTACIAEFVGTFLLVFTVGCNVLSGNGTWGAVSIACVLMVSIYAFGAASGGHLNPAVSVALQLLHKLDKGWTQVVVYCVSQISGGVAAAFSYSYLFDKRFSLAPKQGHVAGALAVEAIYTFLLCFVVLNAAASKARANKNQSFGLAIGFVIIAGAYGAGALGAGCFNPAVALSITAASADRNLKTCLYFVAVELAGAGMAVLLTTIVRPEEANQSALPPQSPSGYSLQSKLVSEVIGTYILVLTVGLNVLGGSPAVAFSIAASLTCMIYAIGDISGGHFNPAVTLAIHCCGKEKPDWGEAAKYAVSQVFGGVLAAFTYTLVHGKSFPLGAGAGHGWGSIAVAETVFTFVLTFVVLCVAVVDRPPAQEFIGLIIGSTVTAGGFAIGTVSGGCLNPAVSIAIAAAHTLNGGFVMKAVFYTGCQLVGAVIAATLFRKLYVVAEPLIMQPLIAKDWTKICLAEFVGTFLLVFTVGCNVLTENAVWGAVSIACVLMVSIYALGGASGGHLNPAVTASLALAGKLDSHGIPVGLQVVLYWCSQISGGLAAAVSYHLLFDQGFVLAAKPGHNVGAHVCELLYTFMLCFVVLNTAASKAKAGKNQYFGLAIGFVIIAGGYGAGALGAGCFNPAVAMGIFAGADFLNQEDEVEAGKRCIFYIVVELAGAALAAILFSIVRPEEKNADQPPRDYSLQSKLICEFIGTYILVVTVGLNVLGGSPAAAFSIAAALTCMIYAIGDISGGHFNPAVTLAIHGCGKGKPDISEAVQYILAQVAGGICAAFTYSICHNGETFPLGPGAGFDVQRALIAEAAFTFVLASVVLCVAVVDDQPAAEFIGLIIGSCVTVGGFAIGGISGGALNPAVAIAIAVVHSVQRSLGGSLATMALGYTAAELGAGAAAAALFSVLYGAKQAPPSPPQQTLSASPA